MYRKKNVPTCKKPGDWRPSPPCLPVSLNDKSSVRRMMLARFRTTHDQFAAEEFLVVQLLHGTFRLFDGQHLDEGEPLRTLVVFVRHYLGVLHGSHAIEELKEIALRRIERQIPDIKPGSGDFDRFRSARRPRTLETVVARRLRHRSGGRFSTGKKPCNFLPERFLRRRPRWRALVARAIVAPSAGAATRTPAISPR